MLPFFIPQEDHSKTRFIKHFIKCSRINPQFLILTANLIMHLYFSFPAFPVLLSHLSLQYPACNLLSLALLPWGLMLRNLLLELVLYNRSLKWVLEFESSSSQTADGTYGRTLAYKSIMISHNLPLADWNEVQMQS